MADVAYSSCQSKEYRKQKLCNPALIFFVVRLNLECLLSMNHYTFLQICLERQSKDCVPVGAFSATPSSDMGYKLREASS